MPPIQRSLHLTSAVYVRASRFAKNEPNAAILARLSVIGDRFARYLPPNFCVQLPPESAVLHQELRLFLSPAMRNSLTMCHVFRMKVLFSDAVELHTTTCSDEMLTSLFAAMRSKLTYIRQLDVILSDWYGDVIAPSDTLRCALYSSFPPSLQSLTLTAASHCFSITASDILLLSAIPHLHELRLLGDDVKVSQDGIAELFREEEERKEDDDDDDHNDKKTTREKSAGGGICFFPALQRLEATVEQESYLDFLPRAKRSKLLPQLWEFALRLPHDRDIDLNVLNPLC